MWGELNILERLLFSFVSFLVYVRVDVAHIRKHGLALHLIGSKIQYPIDFQSTFDSPALFHSSFNVHHFPLSPILSTLLHSQSHSTQTIASWRHVYFEASTTRWTPTSAMIEPEKKCYLSNSLASRALDCIYV